MTEEKRYVVSEKDSDVHEGWTGLEVGVGVDGQPFIEEVKQYGGNDRIWLFEEEIEPLREALSKAVNEDDSYVGEHPRHRERAEKWNVGCPYDPNEEVPR